MNVLKKFINTSEVDISVEWSITQNIKEKLETAQFRGNNRRAEDKFIIPVIGPFHGKVNLRGIYKFL